MPLASLLALTQLPQGPSLQPARPVPWVVIEHDPRPGLYHFMWGQQLVRLEDGTYVASFVRPPGGGEKTAVFRSRDRGRTWSSVAELELTICNTLFEKGKDLYLLGVNSWGPDDKKGVLIRRSTDQGETWKTEYLRSDLIYSTSISILEHGGRFWRPFRSNLTGEDPDSVMVASAPVDSDLWRADSWRWSEKLVFPTHGSGYRSCMLSDGGATPVLLFRSRESIDAVVDPSPDGSTLTPRTEPTKWRNCGHTLSSELPRDPRTGSYFVLRSLRSDEEGSQYAAIELVSSKDLIDWESRFTVLMAAGSNPPIFDEGDWLIEDEDLLVLQTVGTHTTNRYPESRQSPSLLGMAQGTGWIFYRVPKFRDRKPEDPPLWGPPPPK